MRALLLSLVAIAALALIGGGIWLMARRHEMKRGGLMLLAGLILLFNLWSWGTLPARPPGAVGPGADEPARTSGEASRQSRRRGPRRAAGRGTGGAGGTVPAARAARRRPGQGDGRGRAGVRKGSG
jgi:hypothetical protein